MRGLVWAAYFFAAGYIVAKLEPDIGTVVKEGYDRLIDYTVTRALDPHPAVFDAEVTEAARANLHATLQAARA